MRFELNCRNAFCVNGWVFLGRDPMGVLTADMLCASCGRIGKVTAVECREWHVKCNGCRWGKWTGQSKAQADWAGDRHLATSPSHLNFVVDYATVERKRKFVRTHFPKNTRLYVDPRLKYVDYEAVLGAFLDSQPDEIPF